MRYFERGRSDFLRLAGVGHADLLAGETPLAFVITALNLQFLKAARIDDALIVRTTYDTLSGPRLTIRQTIERGGEVLCRAEVEAAVIDLTGRPRRAPATLIAAVTPWLKP